MENWGIAEVNKIKEMSFPPTNAKSDELKALQGSQSDRQIAKSFIDELALMSFQKVKECIKWQWTWISASLLWKYSFWCNFRHFHVKYIGACTKPTHINWFNKTQT